MFPRHGYFFIKSAQSDLYIYINGNDEADTKVIIGPKKEDEEDIDYQLWKHENGFVVNKKTNLVMDLEGGDLKSGQKIVQYDRKKTMAHNQRWNIRDGYIYASADPRLVLDTKDEEEGLKVYSEVKKTEDNGSQQWVVEPFQGADE
ncbi:carbohydrate-binding module family 13 protein [Backusella circina FSU 941]|nr:carbohydrate-binding module family 13 protein [Backusella circina FSU 941]